MIGEDQNDIVVAPWTTIKFRVNSAEQTAAAQDDAPSQVNNLSNLYPAEARSSHPLAAATCRYAAAVRFANVDAIVAKAASMAQSQASVQISELLRERHCIARPNR